MMPDEWNLAIRSGREYIRPWYLRNVYFRVFPDRKPSYFDGAWQYAHYPLGPNTREGECPSSGWFARPASQKRQDFLFFPMSDMHFRMQRPHFLMQALSSIGHRCFFLNPHLGRQFQRRADFSPRISKIAPNLFELHVRLKREPVYHHRLLIREESAAIADAVETLRSVLGGGRFIQVVGSPVWWSTAELIRDQSLSPVVYDCHDLIAAFFSTARAIVREEDDLVAGCDLITCSSAVLRDHCVGLGADPGRCALIPNASFGGALPAQTALVRPLPGNRIGYLGALENWFDVESIRHAASIRPMWHFVLAGRVEAKNIRNRLSHLPNVEFAGEIPHERVPEFLANLDVATIPFLLNNLTNAVDPIKLYEYLAAGLPVVSSRLPETLRFSTLVHYYDSLENFTHAIESALDDRSRRKKLLRCAAVAAETWDARAEQLLRFLSPFLNKASSTNAR